MVTKKCQFSALDMHQAENQRVHEELSDALANRGTVQRNTGSLRIRDISSRVLLIATARQACSYLCPVLAKSSQAI
jgi:hypothetical protein